MLRTNHGTQKNKWKPPPKRKAIEPFDLQFNCPFCSHEKSCEVKMDNGRNIAKITCRVCLEEYHATIKFRQSHLMFVTIVLMPVKVLIEFFCMITCCDLTCCNTTVITAKIYESMYRFEPYS